MCVCERERDGGECGAGGDISVCVCERERECVRVCVCE